MPRLVEVVFNLPVRRAFTYSVEGEVEIGKRVEAPFSGRKLIGFVVATNVPAPADVKLASVHRVIDSEALFGPAYLEFAKWLAGMYFCSLGEALFAMTPGGRRESDLPTFSGDAEVVSPSRIVPSEEQREAVDRITREASGTFYLHGITGSGKTEVFLGVVEATLAEGRSAIYLVPEIALTSQLVDAIRHRFEGLVAVLHSRLSPSMRLAEWSRIRKKEARLVVGARSAVFAPVDRLGLIIVDEEHEGSYKSSQAPRYHARQVAMRRAAVEGARLVMGSATPSAEAWRAVEEGRIAALRLTRRLSGGRLPEVEVVRLAPTDGVFSARLKEELLATHRRGKQSILFLNRRGFTHYFFCRTCGFDLLCGNCSVGMTYHKRRGRMVCHYCGRHDAVPTHCPACGSLDVGFAGFGTQLIEEETRRFFPELRIARLDTDAVRSRGSLERVLDEFRRGGIDVLLGTQMVAKGLNFRGVDLVGILLADSGLHLPDFRSAERTYGLIVQVAGRAGRFSEDGRVIVQTYLPDNDAIRLAAAGLEAEFYEKELSVRRKLGFPPFTRLFRFVVRGRDRAAVWSTAADLAAALRAATEGRADLLGPADCPIEMIARNHRVQILLRTMRFGAVHEAVARVLETFRAPPKTHIEIDVDPVSLL